MNKKYKPIETDDSYVFARYCSACDFPHNDTLTENMRFCWNCGAEIDWGTDGKTDKSLRKLIEEHLESYADKINGAILDNTYDDGYLDGLKHTLGLIDLNITDKMR